MNDVYFKASLQNTLNPEVGTFNNEGNKEGVFTLEDGEYYLTNNTDTSYRVYYPTKHINSVGFTVEFDLNYHYDYGFNWILLFNGNDSAYWHGFGIAEYSLQYRGSSLQDYILTGQDSTDKDKWLHVKCIFDYDHNQNYVDIYIDNVKVNNFTISKDYDIKYIDILGNGGGFVSEAKIKNIIIYKNKEHYLDTTGLTSLWSKIKSLFATKTELASKANTSDLSTVATSGDYNDLINKPNIQVNNDSSLYVERDTDGNFFLFTHNGWSTSGSNAWGGMYFQTSTGHDVFGFAARQTTFGLEKFSVGNNGYLRGYDTNGSRTVTLVINGGTAGRPDTQNITVDGTFVNAGNQRPFSKNSYTIGTSDMPYKAMYAETFIGNVTGNASTATKLATKHTIALSGAATGTATAFDGSGNITIPVTALSGSAITSAITIYDLVPDGAASHRNFYRGKDITAAFNNGTVSANIKNGTFRDIFPGDYITKSITVPQILKADGTTEYIAQTTYNVNFIIADLDIWLNRGDTVTTVHHVAIVPQSVVFNSIMNETNTTGGGYLGSFMNTNVMPAFSTGLRSAFGSAHILQFRFFDTNAVNNNLKSGGIVNYTGATYWGGHDWASHYCHLMTETMVYGAPITASCAADEIMGGVQFAAFRLNSNLVYNRHNYWLGDVVSSTSFADVYGVGNAGTVSASVVLGIRPFALLV